jgi:hypothetical protein
VPTFPLLSKVISTPISFWASTTDETNAYALTKGTYEEIKKRGGKCAALHTVEGLTHSEMSLKQFVHLPMYKWLLAHCTSIHYALARR